MRVAKPSEPGSMRLAIGNIGALSNREPIRRLRDAIPRFLRRMRRVRHLERDTAFTWCGRRMILVRMAGGAGGGEADGASICLRCASVALKYLARAETAE